MARNRLRALIALGGLIKRGVGGGGGGGGGGWGGGGGGGVPCCLMRLSANC